MHVCKCVVCLAYLFRTFSLLLFLSRAPPGLCPHSCDSSCSIHSLRPRWPPQDFRNALCTKAPLVSLLASASHNLLKHPQPCCPLAQPTQWHHQHHRLTELDLALPSLLLVCAPRAPSPGPASLPASGLCATSSSKVFHCLFVPVVGQSGCFGNSYPFPFSGVRFSRHTVFLPLSPPVSVGPQKSWEGNSEL